jgi:hypothetical protein
MLRQPPAVDRTRARTVAALEWRYLPWVIVAAGVLLRLARYLHDKSLWLDESFLALNLMTRSFHGLTETLDWNQGAPLGFLFSEKVALRLFGDSEYSLRLLPLLAGIASIFVFYAAAKPLLSRGAFLIALLLFATLEPFIYYSAELKQYELDALVTVTLFALFVHLVPRPGRLSAGRSAALAATGAVAVWFSHPAVFMLAGFAAALSLLPLLRRDWRTLVVHTSIYTVWAASFLVTYALSIRKLGGLQESVVPTNSPATSAKELLKRIYVIFNDPGSLPRTAVGVTLILAAVGTAALARRNWRIPVLAAGATAAAYVAAYLGKYPLYGRFLLFLLPAAVLLLAAGFDEFLTRLRSLPAALVAAGAVVLLVAPPAARAVKHLVQPPGQEEIRPLVDYVSSHWEAGDTLYVFHSSQYALRYYLTCKDCRGLTARQRSIWPLRLAPGGPAQFSPALASGSRNVVIGSSGHDEAQAYGSDVRKLEGRRRVWLLFTHSFPLSLGQVVAPLNESGRQLDCATRGVAFACLYDFSRAP